MPADADRVPALLGKAGIIDDPGLDRALALDDRQDRGADLSQQRGIGPLTVGHEVVQRLMGGLNARRGDLGRHRLNAFARAREKETGAVGLERCDAIRMAKDVREGADVGGKARLVSQRGAEGIHVSLLYENEPPTIHPNFVTQ